MMNKEEFKELREKMVSQQLMGRGITNPEVLEAFKAVKRHLFVPKDQEKFAYLDCPLPIGQGQTISQPYIVALMTEALDIKKGMSVLEVGTGSGYQAAILCFLGAKVYSIERKPSFAHKAKQVLDSLGFKAEIKTGDGTMGWPEHSPYDRVIVTAASPCLPEPLIEQLKAGGRMVIPAGARFRQDLISAVKVSNSVMKEEKICGCAFVPLIGEYGYKE